MGAPTQAYALVIGIDSMERRCASLRIGKQGFWVPVDFGSRSDYGPILQRSRGMGISIHGRRYELRLRPRGSNQNPSLATTLMTGQTEAFFLPIDEGRNGERFCLFHSAQGDVVRGSVLYIHPFAEEMNKSRRMVALQARALALAGFDVLQIDLLGCGDSSGDSGDANWQDWLNDVRQGCHWLQSRGRSPPSGTAPGDSPPLWLWGLRAGCLLAVEAANQLNDPCNLLFWQPASAGKQILQQFLRLKVAGDMLGGQAKGVMEGIRQQLDGGASVEIAGYMLSSGLASGMEQAALSPPAGQNMVRQLEWLEVSAREGAELSPVSSKIFALWQQAGVDARNHIVSGPSFWQTTEIEDAPALIAATTAALCDARAL
jgi:exosortase A-associated hydrolase 2